MEAKELRIGNWVYFEDSGTSKPYQVVYIGKDTDGFIGYYANLGDISSTLEDHFEDGELYIKPIPLTEEWLLKFGFELWYMDLFSFGKFSIKFSDSKLKLWEVKTITSNLHESETIATVKYVHQLQNLYFALTGEELTLKK